MRYSGQAYKASYDLCLSLEQAVRCFARYHKYSLGADLRDGARRVLKLIVRANSRREKAAVLLEVREELEQLKVILRLCQDVKAFPNLNAFEHAIRQVTEIAKRFRSRTPCCVTRVATRCGSLRALTNPWSSTRSPPTLAFRPHKPAAHQIPSPPSPHRVI